MSSSILLGVTGLPATGKSTIGHYLHRVHRFGVIEGGVELKKIAEKRLKAIASREDYTRLFEDEQRRQSMDWITRKALNLPESRKAHIGMRSLHEAETIWQHGGYIIAATCDIATSLYRIHPNDSKRPHNNEDYRKHVELENSDTQYGPHTSAVIGLADFVICTGGMLLDTFNQVDDIVEKLTA